MGLVVNYPRPQDGSPRRTITLGVRSSTGGGYSTAVWIWLATGIRPGVHSRSGHTVSIGSTGLSPLIGKRCVFSMVRVGIVVVLLLGTKTKRVSGAGGSSCG